MKSIRIFLLITLLSIIMLVNFVSALHGYRDTVAEAQRLFDRQLGASARLLADMPVASGAERVVAQPEAMVMQVWSEDKKLLVRSADAPVKPLSEFAVGFKEINFSGYRWRSLTEYFPDNGHWIIVAERSDLRYQLADKLAIAAVLPILLGLPVAGLLIWFVVGRGLSSLRKLAEALHSKRAEDLTPLPECSPPEELLPVVQSINALLTRLQASFERERRFSADAAHELRTPIAAIQVHAHNLESEFKGTGQKLIPASLVKLEDSVHRMAHLVEQMLDLFRTTPEHYPARFEMLNLHALAREVLAEEYPIFAQRKQQVELLGGRVFIRGDRFALTILLKNLLHNAAKYTPVAGRIKVSTTLVKEDILLRVEDSGPGIPEEEYTRIFERFYRIGGDRHQSTVPGCGLGLSIVQHIARLHGAIIELGQSSFGHGLSVTIRFTKVKEDERD
ncbi:ATP-binding protein [Microbulbifer variabilis]|uniref:ATP-binding protein n=1 Tax=Microbulbifer variabilis TaxID=266805 RepID=UPI001CFD7313|nr:ATP-binding protein [Microbulbifer variabilis]